MPLLISRIAEKDVNANDYIDPEEFRDMATAEKLEKVQVADLVREYLEAQELNFLNPYDLERAVTNFVDKDE